MKRILITLITVTCVAAHAQSPKQLQDQIIALQKQVAALQANNALKLAPFVTVDTNSQLGVYGPNITFHDANVHIVSGSGATDIVTGLGNLIIGYNEDPGLAGHPLYPGQRGGSHNLIIGRWHKFLSTSFGGFLGGELNDIEGRANSIVSGIGNRAVGEDNVIVGGSTNQMGGSCGVVVGGSYNIIGSGARSVILGGMNGYMQGMNSVILGHVDVTEPNDYTISQ